MYTDAYSTAVPDDRISLATDKVVASVLAGSITDIEGEAARVVRTLFCPCLCEGACPGNDPGMADTVAQEVAALVRGRLKALAAAIEGRGSEARL